MIFLTLFLTFLEIGVCSFGGGYGMISLVRETVVAKGWLTEAEFLNLVAVAESTPGPIAVNVATFVGSNCGGFLGALCATIGVVLPSFIIILLIAALLQNILKYAGVQAALNGIRPAVVGLILATACTMMLSSLLNIGNFHSSVAADWKALSILTLLIIVKLLFDKVFKRKLPPIALLLISAVLGVLFYAW